MSEVPDGRLSRLAWQSLPPHEEGWWWVRWCGAMCETHKPFAVHLADGDAVAEQRMVWAEGWESCRLMLAGEILWRCQECGTPAPLAFRERGFCHMCGLRFGLVTSG